MMKIKKKRMKKNLNALHFLNEFKCIKYMHGDTDKLLAIYYG